MENGIVELFKNSIHDIRTQDHITFNEIECEEGDG